jgi:hypothetical protein
MRKHLFKGTILFIYLLLFIEVYKFLFFNFIKEYFLNNYNNSDATLFIVLLSREMPFLIAILITFMFKKRFLLKKEVLIIVIILSYIAARLIW